MTILEKTYKIKSFDEFTKEEQDEIIDKYRYINVDYDDCLHNDAILEDLANNGFNCKWRDLEYDLSYCQGGGACFKCDDFDIDKLAKDFKCKHKQWITDIIKQYCSITIERTNHHYSHEKCMKAYVYNYLPGSHTRIDDIIEEFESYIEGLRCEASCKIYRNLLNDYEYLQSDEAVKDTLLVNEYMFNEKDYSIEG